MPSYTHNFIYNIVYSKNDNNAENKSIASGKEFGSNGTRSETQGSQGKGTQRTAHKEGTGSIRADSEGLPRTWFFSGRNIQEGKRYILHCQRCKTGIEAG